MVAGDICAGIAHFAAIVDANLIDPTLLIAVAIADEITITAQTNLGRTAVCVGPATIGGDTSPGAAKLVWRAITVGGALQRAADALALDAALADGAVEVVVALRRCARDAICVDADHPGGALIVSETLRLGEHTLLVEADQTNWAVGVARALWLLETFKVDAGAVGPAMSVHRALSVEAAVVLAVREGEVRIC